MKTPTYIGQKIIQLFEKHDSDFTYVQELRNELHRQSKIETIKKIGTLSHVYKVILAESIGLTIKQLNAVFQIYCSDFIKTEMMKGRYMLPALIISNVQIDLSKKWGVIKYDGDKYILSNKTVCKDCIDKDSCVNHLGFIASSKDHIARHLELEVYELEEALNLGGK